MSLQNLLLPHTLNFDMAARLTYIIKKKVVHHLFVAQLERVLYLQSRKIWS